MGHGGIHFGMLCPTGTGHLNPMMSLALELKMRGHRVTFYQVLDSGQKLRLAGFDFHPYGLTQFPLGSIPRIEERVGKLSGIEALRLTIKLIGEKTATNLQELPSLMRQDSVNALLVDQVCMEGGTIAEELQLPFITISNALVLNQESRVPPFFTTWGVSENPFARTRNLAAYAIFNRITRSSFEVINRYREKLGFFRFRYFDEAISPLAHISQQTADFDFPRRKLAVPIDYVGPMHDARIREAVPFPHDKLNNLPLIYASMGTLQNRQKEIFSCIANACAELPVQLIMSLGGGASSASLGKLSGSPIVVEYAPQLELLKRASLCITHGGMNTVLEALTNGVPMVAIPITNDQPGVASRLVWKKAGELLTLKNLKPEKLQRLIHKVLSEKSYAEGASRLQESILKSGGAKRAALIIEQALHSRN